VAVEVWPFLDPPFFTIDLPPVVWLPRSLSALGVVHKSFLCVFFFCDDLGRGPSWEFGATFNRFFCTVLSTFAR